MKLDGKKLIFVTGKGGVGKSAVAASIAWQLARKGSKVCLVELGSQSFYESFFETRGITYEGIELAPDLHVALYSPEDCLEEYVVHYIKLPKLYEILFKNRVSRAFLNAAPALAEIALLGKMTSDIRGVIPSGYDTLVVDCYSTGYAMALFRAPVGLSRAFKTGPIHEQSLTTLEAIRNSKLTHFVLVTLAEEMPIVETRELKSQLVDEFNAQTDVVCTRLIKPPVSLADLHKMEGEITERGFKQFVQFVRSRYQNQELHLAKLKEFVPQFYGVPQLTGQVRGQGCLPEISKYLEEPWDSMTF